MKKKFLAALLPVIFFSFAHGQGIVRGKITDKNGETIIGAAVVLKSNRAVGCVTDLDGNYSLKITEAAPQTLLISFLSFKAIEETVNPKNGEVIIKNFVMVSSAMEIGEVQITGKAVKSHDYYMEKIKSKSATTLDYVSSETMKKTGDANVTAAVARVSGVSTNGSFITVRGIGDRYVKTGINGSRIPTLDPFTNNIKLDLFPASLVDNVLITKTANPDLPGDWAGAYLSIETKDFPEQLAINVETSIGYNSQSTFKDVLTTDRSNTDWLGYDNNLRDRDHSTFVEANIQPTQYQELVANGLGTYYNSLGVNAENWGEGTTAGETYFKLGLVQLGLLPPALINDNDAFQKAKIDYLDGPYKNHAFEVLNAGVGKSGQSFSNNWNGTTRKAPLNFSQSFSIGNQVKVFGKTLGFLFGFRYGNNTIYDANSIASRAGVASDGSGNGTLVNTVTSAVDQQVSRETNGWSALGNLSFQFNPNHSVSFLFMPNFIGVNNVRNSIDDREAAKNIITRSQFYEQRRQLVYQFKTEHYFPKTKIRIEANASYTNGKSSAPDFKNVQYYKDTVSQTYLIGGEIGNGIHRYYRYLSDDLFDSRLSVEFPLTKKTEMVRKIKFGGAYQRNDKKSDQYDYSVSEGPYSQLLLTDDDLQQYFSLEHFQMHTYMDIYGQPHSTIDQYYSLSNSSADHTFGNSEVSAGFVMTDFSITPRLRFSGGVRVEQANIFTDVDKFDSLGYPVNDPRRDYREGYPAANPGKLDELSILPSANLIYKLKNDEDTPINVRLNYSQTVARPSIRELSDVAIFDYEYNIPVYGNSDLKMVQISNYDLRLESYFKSGDNASVSFFYKDFKNHIEFVGYTWQNVDKSNVAGIELEGRKVLTKHFDIRANVAFIHSETEFVRTRLEISNGIKNYIPMDTVKRPMFGQAPYVVNAILSYTEDTLGLTVSLGYNVQGPRIVIAADVKEVPDIYEQPRDLFDLKISKTVLKHFAVSFTVKDILNTSIRRAYDYSDGTSLDYDRYTFGRNYLLGVSYRL